MHAKLCVQLSQNTVSFSLLFNPTHQFFIFTQKKKKSEAIGYEQEFFFFFFFFSGVLQQQSFIPLLSGITEGTAFLPLPPGNVYSLLASAVDFVGNRQPVDWDRAITVNFELQKRKSCR